jgi:hypothetical protein
MIQSDNLSKRDQKKVLSLNLKSGVLNSEMIEHKFNKIVKIKA